MIQIQLAGTHNTLYIGSHISGPVWTNNVCCLGVFHRVTDHLSLSEKTIVNTFLFLFNKDHTNIDKHPQQQFQYWLLVLAKMFISVHPFPIKPGICMQFLALLWYENIYQINLQLAGVKGSITMFQSSLCFVNVLSISGRLYSTVSVSAYMVKNIAIFNFNTQSYSIYECLEEKRRDTSHTVLCSLKATLRYCF